MTREGGSGAGEHAAAEEEPGYGIGAVSRRLGVPASTLRTWNLRYGIGPSRRSPGGHRRYDDADLRRLEEMNRLIRAGMPPADAARQALRLRPAPGERAASAPAREGAASPESPGRPEPTVPSASAVRPAADPGLLSAAMLARAVTVLDTATVDAGLDAALAAHGVMWTWERLVLPVFAAVTRRQQDTGAGIDVEHLFSDRLQAALARFSARVPSPVHPRPVLLAAAEEEQHALPIHALAAALGVLGVETRVLGARTPYTTLADAMRRLGPAAVFVWSQLRETGDPTPLAGLPGLRPACRVVVGGPGWRDGLPTHVIRVNTFRDALSAVMTTLR
ncbi:MerR family transcriptional regulator [Microbispora bryophytorum]|uniref:MerR family transcriptional regulator n=1 Tax=Microbispora bryophytorum TaxID=1460882 RepID=A0A8H9H4S4_9ACTN|nr:MerR family transcriptional regulator [Microbispora bryophytorum]GGO14782.1 MerR family transcriptional regulator [Microbispora bryophytorum]